MVNELTFDFQIPIIQEHLQKKFINYTIDWANRIVVYLLIEVN